MVEAKGKGWFNVSCRAGWTLLSCTVENLPNTHFDPNRAFWPDNSTCHCYDAFGIKCRAWCTTKKIPEIERRVIILDQDTYVKPESDIYQCSQLSQELVSCNFKGNSDSNLSRATPPKYKTMSLARACIIAGIKNDEFVIGCMHSSNSASLDNKGGYFESANTTQKLACPSTLGNVINCQVRDTTNPNNYAIIKNATTCECFGTEPFFSCEAICLKKTIPY